MRRKGRRSCPALRSAICTQCCGSNRLKRIQCPSSCVYLQQARAVEVERRERELHRKSATASAIELEVASFPVREAIVTYTSIHPDVTDADVIAVLNALEDAVHREMVQGVKVAPQLPEHLMPLAKALMDNVSTMRGELNFPHNAALIRALRAIKQEAETIAHRSDDRRTFIRSLRVSVKPHSLNEFIASLKSADESRAQRRIVLPR
ncbi:MAG: hypothetical protein RMK18_07925 [Armatimonadota bacterium]|nr:hypothetical protein [Armatimonadota bacterium]MCX7778502.1 hypothetical protein [Armatimonadota bacterium]MDW8025772.1 hypothetical protein [Armatimonadota bacterium]